MQNIQGSAPPTGKVAKRRGRQAVKKRNNASGNNNISQSPKVMNPSLDTNWPYCQISSEFEPLFPEISQLEAIRHTPVQSETFTHPKSLMPQSSPDFFGVTSFENPSNMQGGFNAMLSGLNSNNNRITASRAQFQALCESYFNFYCIQGHPVTSSSVNFMINQMCEVQSHMHADAWHHQPAPSRTKLGRQFVASKSCQNGVFSRFGDPGMPNASASKKTEFAVRADTPLDLENNSFSEFEKMMEECLDVVDPAMLEIPFTENDFLLSEFIAAD